MYRKHLMAALMVTNIAAAPAMGLAAELAVQLQPEYAALYYYKASGEPFDFAAAANLAPSVAKANAFDKQQAAQAEIDRLHKASDQVTGDRTFLTSVNTPISDYDFGAGEFSIGMFGPGSFVPMAAFNKRYQLIFENADAIRAIKMPKEEARQFDAAIGPGRAVVAQVYYRLTGAGDPTGVSASANTIRAQVSKVRLLKLSGAVLKDIEAPSEVSQAAAVKPTPAVPDVHGLRLGMTEAALTEAAKSGFAGAPLSIGNDEPCGGITFLALKLPTPGAVCVKYELGAGVVTHLVVRQVLADSPSIANDIRLALIDKYGPVAVADRSGYGFGTPLSASRQPKDYSISASLDFHVTTTNYDAGARGVPVLAITLTDPASAPGHSAAAPASPTAPKL